MQNVHIIKDFLRKPRKITILMHHKPDADALGSSLGLAGYLKKAMHDVTVVSPSDYPDFLAWLPGNEHVLVFKHETRDYIEKIIKQSDIIFCLDFSNLNRINELGEFVRESPAQKVMIDHHLEPEDFAHFKQWDISAASTAQLVYQFILEMDDQSFIDPSIASCLYAGLMTDTGGFRHSNTQHKEFLIAAQLVECGANPHEISKLVYDNNSIERLRLMGYVLEKKLNILPDFKTAYITLTREELKRFDSKTGDTEGLVNFGLAIKNIVMSVLIYERRDNIKLSFRSLGDFSVNDLARKHFEGGGHRNAAGGQATLTLEETLQKFLNLLPEYKDQLTLTR